MLNFIAITYDCTRYSRLRKSHFLGTQCSILCNTMSACLTMSTDRLETNCRDHFVEKKNVINGLHGCVADVRSWLQQLGLADRKCLWLYLPFVIFVSINHSFLTGRSLPPMSTAPLNYRNCHCTATPLMTESSSTINRRYRVQLVRLFGPSLI